MYSMIFNISTVKITIKPKEKIMTNNEPMMEVIINAKRDMDKPIISACFLMFRYNSNFLKLTKFLNLKSLNEALYNNSN